MYRLRGLVAQDTNPNIKKKTYITRFKVFQKFSLHFNRISYIMRTKKVLSRY